MACFLLKYQIMSAYGIALAGIVTNIHIGRDDFEIENIEPSSLKEFCLFAKIKK